MYALDGNGPVQLEVSLVLVVAHRDTVPVSDQDGPQCLQTDVVYVEILEAQLASDVMTEGSVDIETSHSQVPSWSSAVLREVSTGTAILGNCVALRRIIIIILISPVQKSPVKGSFVL